MNNTVSTSGIRITGVTREAGVEDGKVNLDVRFAVNGRDMDVHHAMVSVCYHWSDRPNEVIPGAEAFISLAERMPSMSEENEGLRRARDMLIAEKNKLVEDANDARAYINSLREQLGRADERLDMARLTLRTIARVCEGDPLALAQAGLLLVKS